jgi:hypothetical protein
VSDVLLPHAADFFAYARLRQSILIKRRRGDSFPWTDDRILGRFSFTNVFREDDRVTIWFRENVRDRYRRQPEALAATMLFRWFNTIRTGETIFNKSELFARGLIFDLMTRAMTYQEVDAAFVIARRALDAQGEPWVTGAYMIRSPDGMEKMPGLLYWIKDWWTRRHPVQFRGQPPLMNWREFAEYCLGHRGEVKLSTAWKYVEQVMGMGPFLAYEVITDLRHTDLLDMAPDVMTWANPGPGALRGANRVMGTSAIGRKNRATKASREDTFAVMRGLLEMSRDPRFWPQPAKWQDDAAQKQAVAHEGYVVPVYSKMWNMGWPAWEMREVEHTLCEFDKYERTRLGQGRPRGNFIDPSKRRPR